MLFEDQYRSLEDRAGIAEGTARARAAAIAMAEGPEKGLVLLEGISLRGYHLLPAARADLLRRLGRCAEAAAAYREALALVKHPAERRFLERRLAEVTAGRQIDSTPHRSTDR